MQPAITHTTVEEFELFIRQPENSERRFELIRGEIVELVSTRRPSKIAMTIGAPLQIFVKTSKLGEVTGADGGYQVGSDRVIPDIGFVAAARIPADSDDQVWFEFAPDLAVEVLSPTDKPRLVRLKLSAYLAAGTIIWLVDPEEQTIEIHTPGQTPQLLTIQDTLTGGSLLPGFALPLAEIFA